MTGTWGARAPSGARAASGRFATALTALPAGPRDHIAVLRQLARHLVETDAQRLSMIGPALAAPDLERVERARDHDVLLEPRELAELRRDQRPAGAVDRDTPSRWQP